MVNPYRGEVELTLNDEVLVMRLSLGVLAELEATCEDASLLKLVERFENGNFKTDDLIALIYAGLRGGGWAGSKDDLLAGHIKGGAVGAALAAGELLKCSFSLPE